MRRGDIAVIAAQGDHGKPRPALIIQTDFAQDTTLILVVPLTSTKADAPFARIAIRSSPATGLSTLSYAMLDRITSVPRRKVGKVIGQADAATMREINRALAVFMGLA